MSFDYNVALSQNKHHQKLIEHSKHASTARLNMQVFM